MIDPRMASISVALFDLDRTVIDCNSGRLWLAAEWRAGRVSLRDAAWGSYVLLQYSLGVAELEDAYAHAVASLAGIEEAAIAERTRVWFEAEVRRRVRPGAVEALTAHREQGHMLVLATSSSAYAADEARSAFGFDDCVSSRFEVDGGRFTGRLSASAFGAAKADRVSEWAVRRGIDLAGCVFYTDSFSDLALLERVGVPVAVNPDRRLRRAAVERGWTVTDWGAARG